mmetsp:Transcript_20066/g.69112  ORF Transcript_20066/g.69112 Transcript_20066/m.69112 type:complete len:81 (+) Transcript_20066:81-323(+)
MAVRTLRALTVDSLLLFVAQNDVAGEDREAIDGVLCENVILHRVTALKALRRAEQSRGFLGTAPRHGPDRTARRRPAAVR